MYVKTGTISTQQKMCSRRVILQPFFSLCFVYSLVIFHSKQQAKYRIKITVCIHFSLLIACQFPWLTRFSFPPCFAEHFVFRNKNIPNITSLKQSNKKNRLVSVSLCESLISFPGSRASLFRLASEHFIFRYNPIVVKSLKQSKGAARNLQASRFLAEKNMPLRVVLQWCFR